MPYSAKQIANAFLNKAKEEGESLSPMKLQKLVYLAHGWHLGLTGKPLINEQVEAWKFGPVISSLYHEFKEFGNGNITRPAQTIVLDEDMDITWKPVSLPRDSAVDTLVTRIWDVYGKYSAVQLSRLTHQDGTPWSETLKAEGGDIPLHTDIRPELIQGHFADLARSGA